MKRFVLLTIIFVCGNAAVFAQTGVNRYEVELVENPNPGKKDTRQINSVLVFEKDSLKIISRRSNTVFREFKYSEIKTVEHSFSKNVFFSSDENLRSLFLSVFVGPTLLRTKKEKHWVAIVGGDNFAVLKIENDNYRLIRLEFTVKNLKVETINEERQ